MKIHYYLQNEKGYKIYRSSLDIAEDKKLPSTAVKDTDFPLPEATEQSSIVCKMFMRIK